MKAWKEYTGSERGMMITIVVLLVVVLLSFDRVTEGVKKGTSFFFGPPDSSVPK